MDYDFNSLNLNLLRALKALLEERSVTKAAIICNVTQSAMSVSLKKLRNHFQNVLLTKGEQDYLTLTPFADALKEKVLDVMQRIEMVFSFEEQFDPYHSSSTIVIGMSDYIGFVLLPPLLKKLERIAPKIKIIQVSLNYLEDINPFNRYKLDFAIGNFLSAPETLMNTKLFNDHNVIVACKNHPLMKLKKIMMDDLVAFPQIFVSLERGIDNNFILEMIKNQGYSPTVKLITPYTLLALHALPNTQNITNTVTKLAIPHLDSLGLAMQAAPYDIRTYEAKLYWPVLYQESILHRWFRKLLKEITSHL